MDEMALGHLTNNMNALFHANECSFLRRLKWNPIQHRQQLGLPVGRLFPYARKLSGVLIYVSGWTGLRYWKVSGVYP